MKHTLQNLWQRWFGETQAEEHSVTPAPAKTLSTPPGSPIAHDATPVSEPAPQAAPDTIQPVAVSSAATEKSLAEPATPLKAELKTELKPEPIGQASKPLQAWQPVFPIEKLFFDWSMGFSGNQQAAEQEQAILQALYQLLASDLSDAVVVPRVPSVIPQLLASLRDRKTSSAELVRQIVKDVVLVGEVINTVNSVMYSPADRINNLEKAVYLLGEEGLRLVIAKVTMHPIINLGGGHYTRRATPHLWAQAEKCALACHVLARAGHPDGVSEIDPFQAFLTGLMKNVGMVVALKVMDQHAENQRVKYSASFQAVMNSITTTLCYRIAQRWNFPEAMCQALQQQAFGRKQPEWTALGHLLHTADLISKTRVLVNHQQLNPNEKALTYGLDEVATACFHDLNHIPLFDPSGQTD